jgi:hypothetical protein
MQTKNVAEKWLHFLRENGILFFQDVLETMVLSNFEDENDLQFFQKLKQSLAPVPPSFVVILEQQTIPSSLNPICSIFVSKIKKQSRMDQQTRLVLLLEPKRLIFIPLK